MGQKEYHQREAPKLREDAIRDIIRGGMSIVEFRVSGAARASQLQLLCNHGCKRPSNDISKISDRNGLRLVHGDLIIFTPKWMGYIWQQSFLKIRSANRHLGRLDGSILLHLRISDL